MSPPSADAPIARRRIGLAVLVAVLFGLAELPFASFMADDLIQLGVLEGVLPCPGCSPWRLYTISDGVPAHLRAMQDAGALPWFVDPAFKMAFLRPLTSALLALDHRVWRLWPVGYRLHGAAWFVALVAGVGLVLRRALPGRIGTLALLVFTLSGIHGILCWNATRHIVVAGALGVVALAAHVRWRETGWRPGRIVSLVALALSLGASEAGVAMFAYLVAYEAVGASDGVETRVRAVAPAVVLVALYVVGYRSAGYGATGGDYVDALAEPVAFLVELPSRWVFLVGALVAGGNADLWVLRPDLRPTLGLVAGLLVVVAACCVRSAWTTASARDRRGARWLVAGAAAATVSFAGTPIGSRCLVLPMIGGSVAIALVLERWWGVLRHRSGVRAALVSAACIALAVIHLGCAPIARLVAPYALRRVMHDRLVTAMAEAELDPDALPRQRVVVLRAPDLVVGLHPFFFRSLQRMPMPRSWRTLSWAPYGHRFTRTAADTLELELVDGELAAPSLHVGDVIELDGLRTTVLARGTHGPSRVAFRFDRPLDDPALYFLSWRDGRLRHVIPPPIGGRLEL